ncbi:hypothetical protein [Alcanivorax sp.]|nr:hypothetical protein [Alcanivorax sp.]
MWPLFWFFADEKHRLCLIDRSVARNAGIAGWLDAKRLMLDVKSAG